MRAITLSKVSAITALLCVSVLTGCSSTPNNWSRVDGRPGDGAQFQAVMAQCKGEGAQNAPGWGGHGLIGMGIAASASNSNKNDIITGCLARNGYIETAAAQ